MIGATGTKASYTLLASLTFQAWKVIWRQQHPMPNAMASILIYGVVGPGLAGTTISAGIFDEMQVTHRNVHYFRELRFRLEAPCACRRKLGL